MYVCVYVCIYTYTFIFSEALHFDIVPNSGTKTRVSTATNWRATVALAWHPDLQNMWALQGLRHPDPEQ